MKKLKKLNNRRFSPSFTLIELLIVIIIIGILISSISFNLTPDKLNLAADEIIKNIRYTQSLALKDDKYYPFPEDNTSVIDLNRSKYWFKQWWQIRFTRNKNNGKDYWYEIFSDVPSTSYNFDGTAHYPVKDWYKSIATDSNGNLLIGNCGVSQYPDCDKINKDLNLSKYGIKDVYFNESHVAFNNSKRIIFDNYGNLFLKEGPTFKSSNKDPGDINPLDKSYRNILTSTANLKLCTILDCKTKKDTKHCIQINITPTGEVYKTKCVW